MQALIYRFNKKLERVGPLLADPPRCNFITRKNPPFQQSVYKHCQKGGGEWGVIKPPLKFLEHFLLEFNIWAKSRGGE